jgi:protein-S-isoprenylcysteine O-methyltransferase Ste14
MQIIRARREAAILEATFGEEYRRYREQTWF